MSPPLLLHRDIHFCEIDGDFIFLDVENDRYFTLTDADALSFQDLVASQTCAGPSDGSRVFAQQLLGKGILVRDVSQGKALKSCAQPEPRHRQSIDLSPSLTRSALPFIIPAFFAFGQARLFLSMFSFKQNLGHAKRWSSGCRSVRVVPVERAVSLTTSCLSFTPLLFSSKDQCLLRSFFLYRFLTLFGIRPIWRFGVQHSPFNAHCWIEYSGQPLNEHPDNTRNFTVILSI